MLHKISILFVTALLSAGIACGQPAFAAWYTQVNKGQSWETYSRTGDRADIVVTLSGAGGRLVFWRGNSYLPYWETKKGNWNFSEIIPRTGNGPAGMPDKANVYSYAKIISSTPGQIVIQWRYLARFEEGNPHKGIDPDNFVEETFTITPDGQVKREIKKGTKKIADWNDPGYTTTQWVQLSVDGIRQTGLRKPVRTFKEQRAQGERVKGPLPAAGPRFLFHFDEAAGDSVVEAVHGIRSAVPGNRTLWKRGVSGTALEFDGYNTVVSVPAGKDSLRTGTSLTLDGWIALGAYPWNWAPLVQQGDSDGYFLGIDSHGYPGFMAKIGTVWETLTVPNAPPYHDPNHLQLFRWYNLAGTYNRQDGVMRLFIDGKEVASKVVGKKGLHPAACDIRIGKAGIMRTPTEGTHDTYPSNFGMDGLIDEVQVYDLALSPAQVLATCQTLSPGAGALHAPGLERRKFPVPATHGKFQAVYTHLSYYESWENMFRFGKYADVVVGFDQSPVKYVFWRGVSYIPMIVNEKGQWFTNQFDETGFTKDAPGDCEPMSDKGCWDSQVRIIENSPARVVVNWRYRQADPSHHWANYDTATGWGDVSDWDYYIYPDGVACKVLRWYSSKPKEWHEWDEQIAVLGEGQHPESVLEKTPVMTLVDTTGKARDYDWNPDPPKPDFKGTMIQQIHYTGRFDPYTIQQFTDGDVYEGERTWYSVFPSWNHWPTAQINSSGRNASFPDRASHSSITHLYWPLSGEQDGPTAFQEKLLLEGMSDQPAVRLTGLARSWLHAPAVTSVTGGVSNGYSAAHRAYRFVFGQAPLRFQIAATSARPIRNLCFEIGNWKSPVANARVRINGHAVDAGPDFRQGVVIDTDGTYSLIVWLNDDATEAQSFEISKPL